MTNRGTATERDQVKRTKSELEVKNKKEKEERTNKKLDLVWVFVLREKRENNFPDPNVKYLDEGGASLSIRSF